jgi:hypothetical protein
MLRRAAGDAAIAVRVRTYCLLLAVGSAAYFANLGARHDAGEGERQRQVEQSPSRRSEFASYCRHDVATATRLLDAW